MITLEKKLINLYKGLEKLGFIASKNYRKPKPGVASKSLFLNNMEIFTLEKHHCGDAGEGELFLPTFRYGNNYCIYFTELEEVIKLLESLYLIKPVESPVINLKKI